LFVDKILYKHRVLSDSISNDPKKKLLGHLLLIKAKYDAFCRRSGTQIPNLTKKEMSVELCIASVIAFRLRNYDKTKFFVYAAFSQNRLLKVSIFFYILRSIKQKIARLFNPTSNELSLIYSKVNREIKKQLAQNGHKLKVVNRTQCQVLRSLWP